MTAKIISGKEVAQQIREELKKEVAEMKEKHKDQIDKMKKYSDNYNQLKAMFQKIKEKKKEIVHYCLGTNISKSSRHFNSVLMDITLTQAGKENHIS